MEIRDPVHGSINILDEFIPIIENPCFQRLRNIKQLGFSEYVFPGATHSRYLHSIGVMNVAGLIFNKLFPDTAFSKNKDWIRLRETLRLACLLHDIGHAPLSHSTESVMPALSTLKLPTVFKEAQDRQANHEDYTLKFITDSSLTEAMKSAMAQFGVNPTAIAELVKGQSSQPAYFEINNVNYFNLLHQLVSSEMDCDRMDYLLRDSYFCGVSYGQFNLDWLIDNLTICIDKKQAYLGISERAISTFDDFLISRFHMFMMVYFHYRAVCLEQMLYRYFKTSHEYNIPSSLEEYLDHDDAHLQKILKKSKNIWAQRIINNNIPKKILETFGSGEIGKVDTLENFLKKESIDYIKCSSSGRISKYYHLDDQQQKPAIKVMKKSLINQAPIIKNIHEATDLYEKYSKTHAVTRIHLDWDQLTAPHKKSIMELVD